MIVDVANVIRDDMTRTKADLAAAVKLVEDLDDRLKRLEVSKVCDHKWERIEKHPMNVVECTECGCQAYFDD